MNLNDWTEYFTPVDIAKDLVCAIRAKHEPSSVVDICAGTGNLLHAVSDRWPTAQVVGNDRYRKRRPSSVDVWSSMDGRQFALERLGKGIRFDLVVANPPFGDECGGIGEQRDTKTPFSQLLQARRIEIGMTAAAAALVAPSGVLATVLPETVLVGERYLALRTWLSGRFCCFDVRPIHRGRFARKDLGLVMLTGYREHSGPCGKHLRTDPTSVHQKAFASCRGTLSSSDLRATGTLKVVHSGGTPSGRSLVVRYTEPKLLGTRIVGRLDHKDLLVVRVGRSAGRTCVFRGKSGTLFSDCVFRVRASSEVIRAALEKMSRDGTLERELRQHKSGLGAQHITKVKLDESIGVCLSRLGFEISSGYSQDTERSE